MDPNDHMKSVGIAVSTLQCFEHLLQIPQLHTLKRCLRAVGIQKRSLNKRVLNYLRHDAYPRGIRTAIRPVVIRPRSSYQ